MDDATKPEHADPTRYAELAGFAGDWRDLWWNEDYLALCARRLELGHVGRALDVGCGAGHWGQRLLPHLAPDARLVGVDREPAFLRLAAARAAERGIAERVELRAATAEALPFADGSFDLVTCQTALIHVRDAAAVLREMARVARPGGLVLASEPDNLAETAAFLNAWPRPDPEDVLELLRFQQTCQAGKIALGEGDGSVGGLLPGLFAGAGLCDVRVWSNDRCAALVPPYGSRDQALDLATQRGWCADDAWVTGTRADSLRTFTAGGGSAGDFEAHWARVLRWIRAFERDTDARRFHAARGVTLYLVAGRRA